MKAILAAAILLLAVSAMRIHRQMQTIDALIELNHDKSVWIDQGCRGEFKGTEERLSTERAK